MERNMGTRLIVAAVLGTAALLIHFDSGAAEKNAPPKLAEGNTAFAVSMYQQLRGAEGNLFFSPYSISTALAMTYAGARGETERQMAQALRFSLPPVQLHAAFADLQEGLNAVQRKGDVQLLVANSLWPHQAYPFKADYLQLVEKHYRTSIAALDYAGQTEQARLTINRWVEEKTKDKIKDLFPPGVLNPLTRMVLANAIYFKGNWAHQFKTRQTRDMPFQTAPGKSVKAPLMYQLESFGYFQDARLQALELPYVGEQLAMVVVLPKQVDGLAELEKELSAANLILWTGKLRKQKVDVWLPKFKMTSTFGLNDKLRALGMADAFSEGKADFSGMDGSRKLFISAVLHKAFVEVNEEGTAAAAATGVGIGVTSIPNYPKFRADHPFLFLIRDRTTGSVLFLGRVADPTGK